MSNGRGGESSRGIESSSKKKRRRNDCYAQSIARIAVAQVCESLGFHGFQQSALDTFSDIACKYIQNIGKTSNFYANLAGRTKSNAFDIVHGLETLSLPQGFVGASDIDRCLSSSGAVEEISQYVGVSEETGFAYSIPPFPVILERDRDLTSSFLQAGEVPPTDEIPPWLPRFPDPKTYTSLPSIRIEETEVRLEVVEQEQKVTEQSSKKLVQRLACNGSELPIVFDHGDNAGRERANNPFLYVPLRSGEKEVSLVSLPAKLMEEDMVRNHILWANHVSTLEAFAPAIQAVKSNECDSEEGGKKDLSESRPAVKLKFRMRNNPLDNRNNEVNAEAMSWFVSEEVRDDKKRRKEKTLSESMDIGEHIGGDSVVN